MSMSALLQNSFSLSHLSCNVDNGNGGSLVEATLFVTIDSHTIISKQKCDDQIGMTEREILQEITDKQLP